MRSPFEGGAQLKFYFLVGTLIWRGRRSFRKIQCFDLLKASRVLPLIISAIDTNIFTPMLLLCIFSFQNFIWFKRFLRFFPIHYFKPTQAGGSYSWGKIFWFRQPLPQIVDLDPQDQTLRHFSYQSFIFMCPLFTKNCADLTKISDSNFVCEVDLKCCYSNLVRIGLVRILVCNFS